MNIAITILMVIICIQLFLNVVLLNELEKRIDREDRYYRRLRMDYDKRVQQLKEEIRQRDELLRR